MALSETSPLIPGKMDSASPSFTSARVASEEKTRPQAIAHRGYKEAFPENTMGAFRGAVKTGSHAIETDVHLSKDGVVVISHDLDLKRCFGREEKIIDCDWSYLETLKTLKTPHESMPRLKDLLEYLAEPGLEDIWVLLDIKVHDDAHDMMRLIASTIAEVAPSSKPWTERILLGCWTLRYLPLCTNYLPGFPIVHIGFSIMYAREFLKTPGVSFNMLQQITVGPYGDSFMKDLRAANRSLFLWTVNDEKAMKWCIYKGVDGVITDDPKKYLEVSEGCKGEKVRLSISSILSVLWINVLVVIFGPILYRKARLQALKEEKKRGNLQS